KVPTVTDDGHAVRIGRSGRSQDRQVEGRTHYGLADHAASRRSRRARRAASELPLGRCTWWVALTKFHTAPRRRGFGRAESSCRDAWKAEGRASRRRPPCAPLNV